MPSPVQITFRDIPSTPALVAHVERRSDKLSTFFERIVGCHVVLEAPHRHRKQGRKYHVRVDMFVPEKNLVVSRNPEGATDDMHAAVDKAFDDAERVLEDYARQLKPDTKLRLKPPQGHVTKIFHDRGYGFIETRDGGHEVYFHRNSVLNDKFDKLAIGAKVRFAEEDGDKGPKASSVYVVRAS